jgi:protein-disulfide isomerase
MNRSTQVYVVIGFIVIVIVATVAAAYFSSGTQSSGATTNEPTTAPITSSDHTKGPADAKVTLIEYGDYQCPACGAYEPIVEQLEQAYSGRVLFVFRNFPLTQLHQDAMPAAEAAEAAALQGKFWEMHDLLYKDQNVWSDTSADQVFAKYYNGYAQSLGLDMTKFSADATGSMVGQKIQSDVAAANASVVDHTPTFFVNLTEIPNPTSYQQFASILDAALATSSATSTAK